MKSEFYHTLGKKNKFYYFIMLKEILVIPGVQ